MLWQFVILISFCATLTGCLSPDRTFVAGEKPKPRPAQAEAPASSIPDPVATRIEPAASQTGAEESKPSVWSNWLGAFSPKKAGPQKPSQPPQRIPLPRTDGQADENPTGTAHVETPTF